MPWPHRSHQGHRRAVPKPPPALWCLLNYTVLPHGPKGPPRGPHRSPSHRSLRLFASNCRSQATAAPTAAPAATSSSPERAGGERSCTGREGGTLLTPPGKAALSPCPKQEPGGMRGHSALRPVQAYFLLVAVPKPHLASPDAFGTKLCPAWGAGQGIFTQHPLTACCSSFCPLGSPEQDKRSKSKKAASGLCQVPLSPALCRVARARQTPFPGTLPAITFSTADSQLQALPAADSSPAVKL